MSDPLERQREAFERYDEEAQEEAERMDDDRQRFIKKYRRNG